MIYNASILPIILFLTIVLSVLTISILSARKASSVSGYFAAGGSIPWQINGIAFAGDYLSAASFLGICGMIAFSGYDGFLYSIGYLAGWVMALFVVAEPMKKLGKYTFTDALDSKFNSKGIQLMAGISTLVVSIFYLIPQMVGAGALVTPLLGLPHYVGVIMVGSIVIFIVATAGMKSTTYVQFIKGGLLIVFSTVLVVLLLTKGLDTKPTDDYHDFIELSVTVSGDEVTAVKDAGYSISGNFKDNKGHFVRLEKDGYDNWYKVKDGKAYEALTIIKPAEGVKLYNGAPIEEQRFYPVGHASKIVVDGKEVDASGPLNPFTYLSTIENSEIVRFVKHAFNFEGDAVSIWYQEITSGREIMRPGLKFKVDKGSTPLSKLNFVSLMLALFFGTSALPHVLIRYYTVPSPRDARKSTILAIVAIGFFYILTLYIGLGAMVNGVLDVESSNMAAPLLAKQFGTVLFAIISAIAFATVLGTVSGLIVAASGAVAHDLISQYMNVEMSDTKKVIIGKTAAVGVGALAIVLGILFKGMNVSFLVGWAFAIAASANFPAIIMLLFWKKTTAKGIASSVGVGMVSAIGIILMSPSMFEKYGLNPDQAFIPLDNPGIISIPLSFITLVVVSLLTQKDNANLSELKSN
ncbi:MULTISPECIES: cation acetate symporter [unclassified Oceanispirochaeta]|uniref:sodium/solute symporter n=1 Tax=unclassified Oceanispirochaeta TaxID=2635722 RepID=UPI000E0943BA|nr:MULTISPECIES: cation acetate symporter [unclassified Oceanispirochaeta]MBF9016314.1 cation acetate symporter [Oceanispirochaeta sp. M2]NPD72777.1 cation acetate symporter [Oceanispirochaeta sp. M1]RDG31622.1 cation acetate symporter [Oceanispirochaeta sp. M1]